VVVLERPKLAPHKARIRENLAKLLGVEPGRVNVKGKTREGLGDEAVEVHAAVLLVRGE
jgi:2-C-methyl-D-erythritol 2,4-cyclodiphosphate synthase